MKATNKQRGQASVVMPEHEEHMVTLGEILAKYPNFAPKTSDNDPKTPSRKTRFFKINNNLAVKIGLVGGFLAAGVSIVVLLIVSG